MACCTISVSTDDLKFSQAMRSYYPMYLEQKSKANIGNNERREVFLLFEAPESFKPGLPLKVKVNTACNVHKCTIKSCSEIFSTTFTGKYIVRDFL